MDTSKLRPDTRLVWEAIKDHPALHGFVLIGGTALTLRIAHRVSEDLDFAYPAVRLPVAQLRIFLRDCRNAGIAFESNQDPIAVEDALNDGLELENYQQDFIANKTVKVTFFAPDAPLPAVLGSTPEARLRVATMEEIFASKVLVCAERSRTRDWFDLYILMTQHGYTMEDFYRVFEKLDNLPKFDIASSRLRSGKPSPGDEGYQQLEANAVSLATIHQFFLTELDRLEIALAKHSFKTLTAPVSESQRKRDS